MPPASSRYLAYTTSAVCLVILLYQGNPAFALLTGIGISLLFNFPLSAHTSNIGKVSLQAAIILLGFKMNISDLWTVSADYGLVISAYVVLTISVGLALGRILGSDPIPNKLISSGTSICGGTTIACLSPVIGAPGHQTAVTLALVFLLNAVALFSFPFIGEYLSLTQTQFGLWCAMAIHDTSSVVATAAIYGEQAFEVATTLKLGRTLWLIPLLLLFSMLEKKGESGAQLPGFILLFVMASVLGSVITLPEVLISGAAVLSKALIVLALFCIGNGIKRSTFKDIERATIIHALTLWSIVVPATLACVLFLI